MNKILNINLGGYAFTIDDDAYEYLTLYLDSLRNRFSASEGRDEILTDIESRLGELITAELGNRSIIMLPDVQAAVQIMGKPEDFGADPIDNQRKMGGSTGKNSSGIKTGRRLFRDEDEKVAGGICSGLAAYFGIQDPVWMRLIFVLLTFLSAGFWIPAYLLMWIIIPPAQSAADRLAMRGAPINVENIAKEVEDGFEKLGDKINEYSKGMKKKSGVNEHRITTGLAQVLKVIGQLFGLFVQFFAKFGLFILAAIVVLVVLGLILGWIGSFWGMLTAAPYLKFFSPLSTGTTFLGVSNLFFVLAIPAVGLALALASALFKIHTPRWLGAGLGSFWLLNLVSAVILGGFAFRSYSHSSTVTHDLDLSQMHSDTIRLEWLGPDDGDGFDQWMGGEPVRIKDAQFQVRNYTDIRIAPSKDGNFRALYNFSARGGTPAEAEQNADAVIFSPVLTGNVLKLPPFLAIPSDQKFRANNINVVIEVPIGKYIVCAEGINNHTWNSKYADKQYRISRYPEKLFRMTPDGLACANCPGFGDRDYQSDESFNSFYLEGSNLSAEIRKSDEFKLTVEDPDHLTNVIRSDRKLTVSCPEGAKGAAARIIIETPDFEELFANNTGTIGIYGFDNDNFSITARGSTQIKGNFDANDLMLNLSGPCKVELFGKGNRLNATLYESASLEASAWQASEVKLTAGSGAQARVFATDQIKVEKDNTCNIRTDGPATHNEQ